MANLWKSFSNKTTFYKNSPWGFKEWKRLSDWTELIRTAHLYGCILGTYARFPMLLFTITEQYNWGFNNSILWLNMYVYVYVLYGTCFKGQIQDAIRLMTDLQSSGFKKWAINERCGGKKWSKKTSGGRILRHEELANIIFLRTMRAYRRVLDIEVMWSGFPFLKDYPDFSVENG